jgi:hypothetical protein
MPSQPNVMLKRPWPSPSPRLLSLPLAEMAHTSKSTLPGFPGAVHRTWKMTSLASP